MFVVKQKSEEAPRQQKQPQSTATSRNFIIFAILLICLHVASSIAYGICIVNRPNYINVTSIFLCIALAFLTVLGFGLVFSYLKKLTWSGVGFALLITAVCIQFHPLANAFWTKVRIQQNPVVNDFSNKDILILGSNYETAQGQQYSNTITTTFKCALAILAAFSSILGRVGPLECLIVTLLGGFAYEFNRQLINVHVNDSFGTLSIFTFGGFMGLALGFIMRMRESNSQGLSTYRHPRNSANIFSVSRAIVGSLIIFLFFPCLAMDLNAHHTINYFNSFIGPFCIVLSMGASLLGSFIVSTLINGKLIARDMIHAPIAGAIVGGSASFFTVNPTQPILAGLAGGILQTLIQNLFEKDNARNGNMLSTISWSLFGVQGFIGGVIATIYMHLAKQGRSNHLNFDPVSIQKNAGFMMLMTLISAGIGLAVGIVAGIVIRIVSDDSSSFQLLTDVQYWFQNDGIHFHDVPRESRILGEPYPQSQTPNQEDEEDGQFEFEEGREGDVKNNRAYL